MLDLLVKAPVTAALCAALALPAPAYASVYSQPASTPEQLAYAKQLYSEGLAALEAESYTVAVQKFEQAYIYAPDKHVFNFNIASAAFAAGDCVKAKSHFQRFLDLVADHPERGQAQERLMEIERTGCAKTAGAVTPTPVPGTTTEPKDDTPESPELKSKRQERAEAAEAERKATTKERKYQFNTLMVTGIALAAVGAAGLITFGVAGGISLANSNKLQDQAKPGPTGFPPGDFSGGETFDAYTVMRNSAFAAYAGAGAAVVFGGTGLALYFVGLKKCKSGEDTGKSARRRSLQLASLGPSLLRGGSGLAASGSFGRPSKRRSSRFQRCD